MGKIYEIDGITYNTLKEVGEAYNKSPQLLISRMKKGKTIEQAAKEPVKKKGTANAEPTTVDGKEYSSFRAACRAHNTKHSTALSRKKNGMNTEDAITGKNSVSATKRATLFRGVIYPSKKKCAEAYEVPYKYVMKREKKLNVPFAEAMEYYIGVKENGK